jgi:hypothetical protein
MVISWFRNQLIHITFGGPILSESDPINSPILIVYFVSKQRISWVTVVFGSSVHNVVYEQESSFGKFIHLNIF